MAATIAIYDIRNIAGSGNAAGSNFHPFETASSTHSGGASQATSAAPTSVPPPLDTVSLSLAASIQSLLQQGLPATEITAQLGVSAEQVNVYLPTYVPPTTEATQTVPVAQLSAPADVHSDSSAAAIERPQI
jgi:hypothetical protein